VWNTARSCRAWFREDQGDHRKDPILKEGETLDKIAIRKIFDENKLWLGLDCEEGNLSDNVIQENSTEHIS
jgi:hypothetical protein